MIETITKEDHSIEVGNYLVVIDYSYDLTTEEGQPYHQDGGGEAPSQDSDNYQYTIIEIFGDDGEEVSKEDFENSTPDYDELILSQIT